MLFRSDRKSTRLNSSHLVISYAVFCLKKKKNQRTASPATIGTRAASPLSAPVHRGDSVHYTHRRAWAGACGSIASVDFFYFFFTRAPPPRIPPLPPPPPLPV